jgi:putative DNA-invertase from lambdoid prophage Rac
LCFAVISVWGLCRLRCVAYIRVSTVEQDEDVQRGAISEFAGSKGVEVVEWYVDKGVSGAKPFRDRPGGRRLLAELDSVRPDCVVAWSLDRIGRSMLDTLNTVLMLEERGVRVVTVKEEWLQSLDPNMRKLVLSIMSWVAEFERRRIRERQEEAWRQGKQKGRPPKVSDEVILKYLRRYRGLSKKAVWKIMVQDGHRLSYDRFLRRVKGLVDTVYVPRRTNL